MTAPDRRRFALSLNESARAPPGRALSSEFIQEFPLKALARSLIESRSRSPVSICLKNNSKDWRKGIERRVQIADFAWVPMKARSIPLAGGGIRLTLNQRGALICEIRRARNGSKSARPSPNLFCHFLSGDSSLSYRWSAISAEQHAPSKAPNERPDRAGLPRLGEAEEPRRAQRALRMRRSRRYGSSSKRPRSGCRARAS